MSHPNRNQFYDIDPNAFRSHLEVYSVVKYFHMSSDKRGLHENICCGYSLEAPAQGLLMSTYNICFHGEIKLYHYLLVEKSSLSGAIFHFSGLLDFGRL